MVFSEFTGYWVAGFCLSKGEVKENRFLIWSLKRIDLQSPEWGRASDGYVQQAEDHGYQVR